MAISSFIRSTDELKFAPEDGVMRLKGIEYSDDPSNITIDKGASAQGLLITKDKFVTQPKADNVLAETVPDGETITGIFPFETPGSVMVHIIVTTSNIYSYYSNQLHLITPISLLVSECEAVWLTETAAERWAACYAAMNYEPDNSALAAVWDKTLSHGTGAASSFRFYDADAINNYALRILTFVGSTSTIYYSHTAAPWVPVPATGYVIEARVKVNNGFQSIYVDDSANKFKVDIHHDKVEVLAAYISEATQKYDIDMTTAYHTIRITVTTTTLEIFIDGVSRIDGTLDTGSPVADEIRFGDDDTAVTAEGSVDWDFIRYCIGGTTTNQYVSVLDPITKKQGDNSVACLIEEGVTGDYLLYEDITNRTFTTSHDYLTGYIKSTIDIVAGALELELSTSDATEAGAVLTVLPALTANTWTPFYVASTYLATDYKSVALNITVDLGADATIWIDNLRAAKPLSGAQASPVTFTEATISSIPSLV